MKGTEKPTIKKNYRPTDKNDQKHFELTFIHCLRYVCLPLGILWELVYPQHEPPLNLCPLPSFVRLSGRPQPNTGRLARTLPSHRTSQTWQRSHSGYPDLQ